MNADEAQIKRTQRSNTEFTEKDFEDTEDRANDRSGLFFAEGYEWIYLRGAVGWDVAGEQTLLLLAGLRWREH